jgi:hypothetical protein
VEGVEEEDANDARCCCREKKEQAALASRGCGWPDGDRKPDKFFVVGDSGLGSVVTAQQFWRHNMHFIGKVQNAHEFCPLKVVFFLLLSIGYLLC